jgi:hypothetical protein
MEIQKSSMLASQLPTKWQPRYILKRIGEEDIEISHGTRDAILNDLANNGRFVQIGEYTIMLNAIKGIDPKWGAKNIPPRPAEKKEYVDQGNNTVGYKVTNEDELQEWDGYFK